MPLAYMLIAFVFGTAASLLWMLSGGAVSSAVLVYILTGNAFVATLLPMAAYRIFE